MTAVGIASILTGCLILAGVGVYSIMRPATADSEAAGAIFILLAGGAAILTVYFASI